MVPRLSQAVRLCRHRLIVFENHYVRRIDHTVRKQMIRPIAMKLIILRLGTGCKKAGIQITTTAQTFLLSHCAVFYATTGVMGIDKI